MSHPSPQLDHIVILVPHSFLVAPPAWLGRLFRLYPGGRHADGVTENVLVLLADGTYLELIAFAPEAPPAQRPRHRWGRRREGAIIDWALTLGGGGAASRSGFEAVRSHVLEQGAGLAYGPLDPGGRERPDGEVLRWLVSAPLRASSTARDEVPLEPGLLPFWCLDETPRERRVPLADGDFTRHACGAVGVARVSVTSPGVDDAEGLERVYGAMLGQARVEGSWALETPVGGDTPGAASVTLASGDELEISISLFTDSKEFAGKTVAGEIGGMRLEFLLVGAK